MTTYTDVIARVPPAAKGVARIVHDRPSEMARLRGAMRGQLLGRDQYARLLIRERVVMTDAEFERRTNADVVLHAKGDALVAGLGIGLILDPLLERCASVTVIEKEQDVIDLVGPSFPKAKIICADIFELKPEGKFDLIYFDIWPDICDDDLEEAKLLQRRFRKCLRKGGWMRSWTTFANSALRGRAG